MSSLYMQYTAAKQMTDRLSAIGGRVGFILFQHDGTVSISQDYYDAKGTWLTPENRDSLANAWLERWPKSTVSRESRYGLEPETKISGETAAGIPWVVEFGRGACERKQVGTKRVEKYDPDALASIQMIEVEEPIYEYFCPDPLASL